MSWVLGTVYVGALGPLITSATVPLSIQFNCAIAEFISGTNGGLIIAIGLFGLLGNAASVVVGKRPVYILGNTLCAASCFWCAYATNLKSLIAARVIQGFGIAPFEILVPPTITDYHHVHTRGIMMSLFNFGVLGGINLASPIAGAIIDHLDLTACFNIAGGFGIFLTIFCFLFMPETAFHRSAALAIDSGSHDNLHKAVEEEEHEKAQATEITHVDTESSQPHQLIGKRQPFYQDLRLWVINLPALTNKQSYRGHDNILVVALRPFRLTLSPVVFWAGIMFCLNLTWAVGIAVTLSQIFSQPPYNFTITQVGLCNMSSFVASALAVPLGSPLSDGVAKFCARRNKGVYEVSAPPTLLMAARIPVMDYPYRHSVQRNWILCLRRLYKHANALGCNGYSRIGMIPFDSINTRGSRTSVSSSQPSQ